MIDELDDAVWRRLVEVDKAAHVALLAVVACGGEAGTAARRRDAVVAARVGAVAVGGERGGVAALDLDVEAVVEAVERGHAQQLHGRRVDADDRARLLVERDERGRGRVAARHHRRAGGGDHGSRFRSRRGRNAHGHRLARRDLERGARGRTLDDGARGGGERSLAATNHRHEAQVAAVALVEKLEDVVVGEYLAHFRFFNVF